MQTIVAPDQSSLSTHLKSITAEVHCHAETRELQRRMIQGVVSHELLGTYLSQILVVHRAIERIFAAHPDVALSIGWSESCHHSVRIESDLVSLGINSGEIDASDATQQYLDWLAQETAKSPIAVLGAFYVLEGSMNGNRFIARVLRRAFGETAPIAYFEPYGELQPQIWATFKTRLDEVEATPSERDAIVMVAMETFAAVSTISDHVVLDQPGTA